MGYLTTMLAAFIISLLRCIYLKVRPVAHVGHDEKTVAMEDGKLEVTVDENPGRGISNGDAALVRTERTRNNNRTLDQSRVFEEV
jgi:hypothetical protein